MASSDDSPDEREVRPDLAEALERRRLTTDAARPEAVERRHASGARTARENLDDLVDEGSLVEYGGLAIAAQRGRRDLDELLARTPADGLIGGTARINGELAGDRAACAVLSYDYTVLAGTQGAVGHRKKDRLFELIERMRLPTVILAEGGGGRPGDTDYAVVSAPGHAGLRALGAALGRRTSDRDRQRALLCGKRDPRRSLRPDRRNGEHGARHGRTGHGLRRRARRLRAGGDRAAVGQAPNGVVDVAVADEAEAVAVAKRLVGYFQGPWTAGARPTRSSSAN